MSSIVIPFIGGLAMFIYGMNIMADGLQPVSYTHLDVYKRQAVPLSGAAQNRGGLVPWADGAESEKYWNYDKK